MAYLVFFSRFLIFFLHMKLKTSKYNAIISTRYIVFVYILFLLFYYLLLPPNPPLDTPLRVGNA